MDKGSTPYKVVVLGDKGVGKTSLVIRFIEGVYTSKQQSTIGKIHPFYSLIHSLIHSLTYPCSYRSVFSIEECKVS